MSIFASLRESAAPSVAVEIAAGRVAGATLEWRGGQAVVASHASEMLPDGALVASLTATNAHDRAAVVAALTRVLGQVGRPRRIGLIIPDIVAKVSIVRFEQVPSGRDLDQLVRWQVRRARRSRSTRRRSAMPGLHAEDGHEFIVTLAKRGVIQEYEQLCADAGAHAGLVDLATLNVINAVLAGRGAPSGDCCWSTSPPTIRRSRCCADRT
jgi:Tfp pilus assembly PilM family ATPase